MHSTRLLPTVFMISDAEDHPAHGIMVEALFEQREGSGPDYENRFLDMAWLQGVSEVCDERITLHRCLQHTKDLCYIQAFFFVLSYGLGKPAKVVPLGRTCGLEVIIQIELKGLHVYLVFI